MNNDLNQNNSMSQNSVPQNNVQQVPTQPQNQFQCTQSTQFNGPTNVPPTKNNKLLPLLVLVVVIIVAAILCFIFFNKNTSSGTSNSSATSTNTSTAEVTNDWKQYSFKINGKIYKLPMNYSDFASATGFTDNLEDSYTIKSNHYTSIYMYSSKTSIISVDIANYGTDTIKVKDGKMIAVSQYSYQADDDTSTVTFPGDLKVNMEMTKDGLVKLFGDPTNSDNYTDEKESYVSDTYTYSADGDKYPTSNYYKIVITNGKIAQLSISGKD